MDAIEIAIFLNEDPDNQAAIVGGIYSNSIGGDDELFTNWDEIKEYVFNQFDNRMLYWYEKYQKAFNLE